jgi:anthranilate 1,2-dioxygenase small subunit
MSGPYVSLDARTIKSEAEDLISAYVHCLDDDRIEEWPDFFADNGVYKIVGRDNFDRGLPIATMSCASKGMMQDRVNAIRNASVYSPRYLRHLVSSIQIAGRDGDTYLAHANFVVFQTLQDDETRVFMAGKYRSKISFIEGSAKFQELTVVYDSLQIPGLLVIPL